MRRRLPLFAPAERAIATLSLLTPPRPREVLPDASALPWREAYATAQEGKLLPLLAWKLRHPCFAQAVLERWPEEARRKLQHHQRRAWMECEHRDIWMQTIRLRLHEHNVPFVLYKGLAYAHSLYPDPTMRSMKDVDLVIPGSSRERAHRALFEAGLEWLPKDPPHPCARTYRSPRTPFFLDVHHRLSWPRHTRIPTDTLVATASHHTHTGDRMFGPTQQFLFHIYHLCKEQLLRQHVPLRAFVELRELYLGLRDSLASVRERALRWGLDRTLAVGLWLLHDLFPGLVPPHEVEVPCDLAGLIRALRHPRWSSSPESKPPALLQGLLLLALVDHPRDRLSYARRRILLALWNRDPAR